MGSLSSDAVFIGCTIILASAFICHALASLREVCASHFEEIRRFGIPLSRDGMSSERLVKYDSLAGIERSLSNVSYSLELLTADQRSEAESERARKFEELFGAPPAAPDSGDEND